MLEEFFSGSLIHSNLIFWFGWMVLPVIVEFIPSLVNFGMLMVKWFTTRNKKSLNYYPQITIIIPIYNSASTLAACIRSINNSTYPNEFIDVICIDNGSKDNSFEIFEQAQMEYGDLSMNWLKSAQGKSNALNMAIFNSEGKYIINIDSDGQLEKAALYNLVRKFENNENVNCMTGAILIDPELIEETPKKQFFLRTFRKTEFMEYAQAFLSGRNFQSVTNSIFTLSGAFSAFRKSTLFKTQMYNTETICEDAHLTFQIKEQLNQKVSLCEDAIFMVDPIEDLNKFYTQRQRWQIGELEVAKMFILKKMRNPLKIWFNSSTRLIIMDHTMVFPKMIWIAVMILLCMINDMAYIIGMSMLFVYILNVISSFLYFLNGILFLKEFEYLKRFYIECGWHVLLLPFYSMHTFVVRFCGILNSIDRKSSWKTKTFTEEKQQINSRILNDFSFVFSMRDFVRKIAEKENDLSV